MDFFILESQICGLLLTGVITSFDSFVAATVVLIVILTRIKVRGGSAAEFMDFFGVAFLAFLEDELAACSCRCMISLAFYSKMTLILRLTLVFSS